MNKEKKQPKFQFSNVVVVEDCLIGVIVKTWQRPNNEYYYDVYVRNSNSISEYDENQIKHYVYSKELSEDEKDWH